MRTGIKNLANRNHIIYTILQGQEKLYKLYTNPTLRVKETKSQRDKETKGERRKDRLFETLMFMNYSRIDHELIF